MITITFICIKAVFIYLFIKFYNQVKDIQLNIPSLNRFISNSKRRLKYIYGICFIFLLVSIFSNESYKTYLNSKPYEEKIIGYWDCSRGYNTILFEGDNYVEVNDDKIAELEINDSVLTLRYSSFESELEILDLTYKKLELYDYKNYTTIKCEK